MSTTSNAAPSRKFEARPDTLDFRDKMYIPTLVDVPTYIPLENYLRFEVPVLDQGAEGACTGFGLATVANYLLRRRQPAPDKAPVSPRMLYELARRYDEWQGEDYSGSSARGAIKGWHKHGICSEDLWPYPLTNADHQGLTDGRALDALKRPLGAYFRVNHKDLVAMHAAIAEVGILYATAIAHEGWLTVGPDGRIRHSENVAGGHAFAIVAYDAEGFWLQNSWGPDWGYQGFCHLGYDDWLQNGTDVWVARLGVPIVHRQPQPAAAAAVPGTAAAGPAAPMHVTLRPHVVSVGNGGQLNPGGEYGLSPAELEQVFRRDIRNTLAGWPKKRLLLYAHGGLVSEQSALQRLAEYRPALLAAGVYPVSFVWHSDYCTTVANILREAIRRRRPEGALDAAKDFMLDRIDDLLEPLARELTGKAAWDEMKENALAASQAGAAADLVARQVAQLAAEFPDLEIHLLGHSAGSIFHAPLLQLLTESGPIAQGPITGRPGLGLRVASCTLWAPACTIALFKESYLPAIQASKVDRFAVYALDDRTEQADDCAKLYNKSLLYLVSNAFEARPRIPLARDGVPLLGLQKFLQQEPTLQELFALPSHALVLSPNDEPEGSQRAAKATRHGDFDEDRRTVQSTLLRILGGVQPAVAQAETRAGAVAEAGFAAPSEAPVPLVFSPSKASLRRQREQIDKATN